MPAVEEQHQTSGDSVAVRQRAHRGKNALLSAVVTLVCLAYSVGLSHYAQVRPVDGDEAYYTTAARLVWEGKTPYRDFSYPQGPLLPYIYSWIWGIKPRSLIAMRFLSAACGTVAVLLWGACLLSMGKLSRRISLATFAIILLNPYWISWNVTVKTHAVANLLMSVAIICLYIALQSGRLRWYLISGAALGTCACARALYGPLIPFALGWLSYREWQISKPFLKKAPIFLMGVMCGLLPIIFSFAADPHAFIFNNFQYRPLLTPHGSALHTLHRYFILMMVPTTHPYFAVELLLTLIGVISLIKMRRNTTLYSPVDYLYYELSFLMMVVYSVTALIPFPPIDQYFHSPVLPFFVVFLAEGLRVTWRYSKTALVLMAALTPFFVFHDLKREIAEYSKAPYLEVGSYERVSEAIKAHSKTDDVVLSFWPGYVFESGRRYFPGAEDHFGYAVATKISPEARTRYHLAGKGEIINAVSNRTLPLLVCAPSPFIFDDTLSHRELKAFYDAVDANYSLVAEIDKVRLYRLR